MQDSTLKPAISYFQTLHCLLPHSSPALHALIEHGLPLVSRAQLLCVELHPCLATLHALLIDLQQTMEVAAELAEPQMAAGAQTGHLVCVKRQLLVAAAGGMSNKV